MDEARRAYAVLGVKPGVLPAELRARYKALVKQWHPDRFAADPQGQAEATSRMRQINDAYRTLLKHLVVDEHVPRGGAGTPASPGTMRSRLSREEVDRIVSAIGTNSPVDNLLNTFDDKLPRHTWEHIAALLAAGACAFCSIWVTSSRGAGGTFMVVYLLVRAHLWYTRMKRQ